MLPNKGFIIFCTDAASPVLLNLLSRVLKMILDIDQLLTLNVLHPTLKAIVAVFLYQGCQICPLNKHAFRMIGAF